MNVPVAAFRLVAASRRDRMSIPQKREEGRSLKRVVDHEQEILTMKRKISLGVSALIAVVAFAVIPAAAQAAPHIYKNGVLLEEGELGDPGSSGLDTISWGTLTLGNATIGALKCENIFAGDVKNPVGGGAGNGVVDGYSAYDCTGPVCEGAGGKFEVIPEGLKEGKEWLGELIEPEAGTIRLKVGNKEEASETKIKFEVVCLVSAIKIKFHGELSPKAINGTEIGIAPSKVEFNVSAGTLESSAGPGEVTGKLKLLGYESQELMTTKNP